jgi:predicted enzyme related to lactoylglutathione lyase
MAVIADPSGATFCLWQQKKHIGAAVWAEHGALSWAELQSRNLDACGKFYAKLFHWEPSTVSPVPGSQYTLFYAGKDQRGGMQAINPMAPAGMPSHWTTYFAVDNCDQRVAQAGKLGGKVIWPGTDIPNVGRFAILADPQGATFGILQCAAK